MGAFLLAGHGGDFASYTYTVKGGITGAGSPFPHHTHTRCPGGIENFGGVFIGEAFWGGSAPYTYTVSGGFSIPWLDSPVSHILTRCHGEDHRCWVPIPPPYTYTVPGGLPVTIHLHGATVRITGAGSHSPTV